MNEVQRPARARMLPTDRIAYSSVAERLRLQLPGGAAPRNDVTSLQGRR
jgi:hypothetical protein